MTVFTNKRRQQRRFFMLAGAIFAIAGAAVFAYYPALNADFVNWDDRGYVLNNPAVQQITPDTLTWMLSGVIWAFWAPLTWLSYAVDYHFFGAGAWGYHLGNILLHAANSVWIFVFIFFWCDKRNLPVHCSAAQSNISAQHKLLAAVSAALLFAWHPQHVEAVAWIASRKDMLSTFFFLAAIFSYLLFRQRQQRYFYGLAVLSGLLAMLSKPIAMVLPVILLILDWYPLQRRLSLRDKLPFFALALLPGIMALVGHREFIAGTDQISFLLRLQNAAEMTLAYVSKWFFPLLLSPYYPYPAAVDTTALLISLGAIVLISVVALYFALKKRPWWLAAWLSFGVMLFPASGLISFNQLMAGADRFTYLATIPFYLLVGGILAQRHWRWALTVMLIAIVFFSLTRAQLPVWQNRISLWSYVAALHPGDYKIRLNLGEAYQQAGNGAQARLQFQHGIAAAPDCLGCYYFLARSYLADGMLQAAVAPLEYCLAHVRQDDPQRAEIYHTAVWLYTQLGENERAAQYEKILKDMP